MKPLQDATHINVRRSYLDKLEVENLQLLKDKGELVAIIDFAKEALLQASKDETAARLSTGITSKYIAVCNSLSRLNPTTEGQTP